MLMLWILGRGIFEMEEAGRGGGDWGGWILMHPVHVCFYIYELSMNEEPV